MDWREFISAGPAVCHGKPCIKGSRVLVSVILDSLAAGSTVDEITRDFPGVSSDAVKSTLSFAADLAGGRLFAGRNAARHTRRRRRRSLWQLTGASEGSPLDVCAVDLGVSTGEIVEMIREGRERYG
jgi:uncharacterized protein (DUF433 family)